MWRRRAGARWRAVVANGRRERPPVRTAREAAGAQAKRLSRDLERICTHDEHALVQRSAGCLEQQQSEEARGHAATAPKTRVAMRSRIILYRRAPFSADARLGRPTEPGDKAGTDPVAPRR